MASSERTPKNISRLPLIRGAASETEGLVTVVRRLASAYKLEEIVQVVTQAARALLAADGVTFVLRDNDLCYYLEEDAISPLWKGKRFPMSACISGWCMLENKPAAIPDIYLDSRIPQDAYRPTFVKSLAMVPVGQDRPSAALGAYWSTPRKISEQELALLQTLANAAALGIGYVQLRERQNALAKSAASAVTAEPTGGVSLKDARPEFLERVIRLAHVQLPQKSPLVFAFAVGCVVLATLARLGIGALVGPFVTPFGTYYPAILVATLVGGLAGGVTALILSVVTAWWMLVPLRLSFDLMHPHTTNLLIFCVANGFIIAVAEGYRRAYRRLDEEQTRRQLLLRELQHRSRNTSAVVQAVIKQSLRAKPDIAEKITSRISALVAADQLVTQSELHRPTLAELILTEVKPFGSERVALKGGEVRLDANCAKALALTFHELATNAAKYGALSKPEGSILITWSIVDGRVQLVWEEFNGPPVAPPGRSGFGTDFVERVFKSIDATIERQYRAQGFRCLIAFPTLRCVS